MTTYYEKYIKYKLKYLGLQKEADTNQIGGKPAKNRKKKYAVTTLLMINDEYMIGCIMLAQSIRQFKESKKIDLICMVTPDISAEAIRDLKQFYDRVVPVDYIQVDRSQIRHSQDKLKDIYSKTFTKINCLRFTEYKKVIMIDVDMLVVRKKFFTLFDVKTPAAPYVGCLVFYKKNILEIYKKEYSELEHGHLVPRKYYDMDCKSLYHKHNITMMADLGIDSTIIILEPNLDDFNKLVAIVQSGKGTFKGDTNLFADYYRYRFHHIDMTFVGRWLNPDEHPEVSVIDLYGYSSKAWQIPNLHHIIEYSEVKYWIRKYIEYYEKIFKKKCKVKKVHELYNVYLDRLNIKKN